MISEKTLFDVLLQLIPLLLAFFVWNRLNARFCGDGFSPFHIVFLSWVMPLYLRTLNLSALEQDWPLRTKLMLGYVTFVLAFVSFVAILLVRRQTFRDRRPVFEQTLARLRSTDFVVILVATYLFVFLVYLVVEFVTNPVGIPVISGLRGRPLGSAHRWGKDTRWAAITGMLFVLTPMVYLAGRAARTKLRRWTLIGLALLYPLFGLMKLSRSDVFVAGLTVGAVELYYRKFHSMRFRLPKLGAMRWTVIIVTGIALLYGTMSIRTNAITDGTTYGEWIRFRWTRTPMAETAAQFYGYAAMPFENFHRTFSTWEGGFNPGASFLRPFLSMVGRGRLADAMLADVPFASVSGAAGSHTFLTDLYAEFAIWGLIFVPLIYAIAINVLYVRFRRRPTPVNMFLYINFLFPWSWLFFNNAFSVLTFYINVVAVMGLAMVWYFARPLPARRSAALTAP